jgi:hypothetical protein
MRAFSPHNEQRIASDRTERTHRRVYAARYHAFGALLQALRSLSLTGCGGRHRALFASKTREVNTVFKRSAIATEYYSSAAHLELTRYSRFCNALATSRQYLEHIKLPF